MSGTRARRTGAPAGSRAGAAPEPVQTAGQGQRVNGADLEALLAQTPAEEALSVEFDVSEGFGQPEGTVVFVLGDPTVAELFGAQTDAQRLKARNPLWPFELCQTVALMAQMHREPRPTRPVGEMYEDIARNRRALFLGLSTAFEEAFPHLADIQTAVKHRKNS